MIRDENFHVLPPLNDFYFVLCQAIGIIDEVVNLIVGGRNLAEEGGVFEADFGGGELFVEEEHLSYLVYHLVMLGFIKRKK